MDDKQMNQLLKLVLLVVAALFAPIWIPVAFITVVPTFLIFAGIISTIALGITTFLTIVLGVLGIPLLFSTAVTAIVYVMYKAFEKIAVKAYRFIKQFLCELKLTKCIWALMEFNPKAFLKGLPIIKRFIASEKDSEDNGQPEQPLYEDESDTETVVHRTKRPSSTHFPFPKASLPLFDISEEGDEIEIFYNNVEDLYAVICALRQSARSRASVSRNASRRVSAS